ncbi:unnamed protein product, partial [Prunus brigantina]
QIVAVQFQTESAASSQLNSLGCAIVKLCNRGQPLLFSYTRKQVFFLISSL